MRALLASLALATVFGVGLAGAEGGHLFRSQGGDESIALIDEKTAEVVLPGNSALRTGRYATRAEGEIHKLEVRLGDGEKLSYRLAEGGLLSERSGKLLRLAPP
jgi:hypothetical protein